MLAVFSFGAVLYDTFNALSPTFCELIVTRLAPAAALEPGS
jgi:hypothetical protein